MFDLRRARKLNEAKAGNGPIVYWMSRDMRVEDNWAMIFAAQLAKQQKTQLQVVFTIVPEFLGATWRQYDFMLNGLLDVEEDLVKLGIDFSFLLCK